MSVVLFKQDGHASLSALELLRSINGKGACRVNDFEFPAYAGVAEQHGRILRQSSGRSKQLVSSIDTLIRNHLLPSPMLVSMSA